MTPAMDVYSEAFCDGHAKGFAAGLAHAREQAAAQLEARALQLDGLSYACSFAAEVLRKQAEKIRSGELPSTTSSASAGAKQ